MLDLDLLTSFVSVVDAGGFTRAGERVHRTQSTVSQQIRRLETAAGRTLFVREGRKVRLTEDGERLLGYARRILALSMEAKAALSGSVPAPIVRLGLTDDFAMAALTRVVGGFAAAHRQVRLAVRCGLSVDLEADLARGDLDVALVKREPGRGGIRASWPEDLVWVAGGPLPEGEPVPLVAFPQGCLYRDRAIHALEGAGRAWRIAYECPNLVGIQAALEGGLGVAVLDRRALLPALRVLGPADGLPPVAATEVCLWVREDAPPAARTLAEALAACCADEAAGIARAA